MAVGVLSLLPLASEAAAAPALAPDPSPATGVSAGPRPDSFAHGQSTPIAPMTPPPAPAAEQHTGMSEPAAAVTTTTITTTTPAPAPAAEQHTGMSEPAAAVTTTTITTTTPGPAHERVSAPRRAPVLAVSPTAAAAPARPAALQPARIEHRAAPRRLRLAPFRDSFVVSLLRAHREPPAVAVRRPAAPPPAPVGRGHNRLLVPAALALLALLVASGSFLWLAYRIGRGPTPGMS
jgi:hypothetical protein